MIFVARGRTSFRLIVASVTVCTVRGQSDTVDFVEFQHKVDRVEFVFVASVYPA